MPYIDTPNGKFKYKTIPLFPGVKQIDKVIANENLKLLKSILDSHDIHFQLHAGTLLGAVREHDFISHDEDIDLALLEKYRCKLLCILPELEEKGFNVCRYDRRDLISVIRKGEYIDFYFYRPYNDKLLSCSGWLVLRNHLEKSVMLEFKGNLYEIPKNWEEYLVAEYGKNWRTPLKWNNYEIPKWKRLIFNLKEHLKDYIPEVISPYLLKKANMNLTELSLNRLRRNLNIETDFQ